jgi:hypothetical protein
MDFAVKDGPRRRDSEDFPSYQGELGVHHASAVLQVGRKSDPSTFASADALTHDRAIKPRIALSRSDYLHPDNWEIDLDSSEFPNSPLGRSQELDEVTHPHLRLDETMTSLPTVNPGDQAWWHCDGVHSVEAGNKGKNASSVLYIPSVPLTVANAKYVKEQLESYRSFLPPPDFPGGKGESDFRGKASEKDILTEAGRQGMGISPFRHENASGDEEWELMRKW